MLTLSEELLDLIKPIPEHERTHVAEPSNNAMDVIRRAAAALKKCVCRFDMAYDETGNAHGAAFWRMAARSAERFAAAQYWLRIEALKKATRPSSYDEDTGWNAAIDAVMALRTKQVADDEPL